MTTQVTAAKETVRGGEGVFGNIKMVLCRTRRGSPDDFVPKCRVAFLHSDSGHSGTAWKWMGFKGKGGKTETKVRNKDWVFSQVNHPVSTKLFAYI